MVLAAFEYVSTVRRLPHRLASLVDSCTPDRKARASIVPRPSTMSDGDSARSEASVGEEQPAPLCSTGEEERHLPSLCSAGMRSLPIGDAAQLLHEQAQVVALSLGVVNTVVSSPAERAARQSLRSELRLAGFEETLATVGESAKRGEPATVQARAYRRDARDDDLEAEGKPRIGGKTLFPTRPTPRFSHV